MVNTIHLQLKQLDGLWEGCMYAYYYWKHWIVLKGMNSLDRPEVWCLFVNNQLCLKDCWWFKADISWINKINHTFRERFIKKQQHKKSNQRSMYGKVFQNWHLPIFSKPYSPWLNMIRLMRPYFYSNRPVTYIKFDFSMFC